MLGAVALLGLALSAPPRPAAGAHAPPAPCTRYRAQAERNDLAPEAEVAAWTSAALDHAALLDPASPCSVHVRITAGPIRTGGREDGFVAHVSVSTRRFLRDGKLVTREKGILLVEPRRDAVAARARSFVDDFVAGLGTSAAADPAGATTAAPTAAPTGAPTGARPGAPAAPRPAAPVSPGAPDGGRAPSDRG